MRDRVIRFAEYLNMERLNIHATSVAAAWISQRITCALPSVPIKGDTSRLAVMAVVTVTLNR
jgi:hypothetical protein